MKLLFIPIVIALLQTSTTLAPKDFQKKIAETKGAVVLDVRTAAEVAGGVIPGAINIDFKSENFEEQIKKLDKTKTYFVYCAGGVRSEKAVAIMNEQGFKKYFDLDGGINAWRADGLKTQKK